MSSPPPCVVLVHETPGQPRRPVRQWYRDPLSCLHTTLATVVMHAGAEPLEVLGLAWRFRFILGDVQPQEYYFPCYDPDLAASVLPYSGATSRWRSAPDREDALACLEESLADQRLPILAVDNYHLPFRPAFHDIHAAHLIVVYGVDRRDDVIFVSDAMPPAFLGPVAADHVVRSWYSAMPQDEGDPFFSGASTRPRWLDVRIDRPLHRLTQPRLHRALEANLRAFRTASDPSSDGTREFEGLPGVSRFASLINNWARDGDRGALADVYTFGWSMQAEAALHGELLRACGTRWMRPDMSEYGRLVERVAHHWTPLRIASAHTSTSQNVMGEHLAGHADRLRRSYESAVAALDDVVHKT